MFNFKFVEFWSLLTHNQFVTTKTTTSTNIFKQTNQYIFAKFTCIFGISPDISCNKKNVAIA